MSNYITGDGAQRPYCGYNYIESLRAHGSQINLDGSTANMKSFILF